MPSPIYINQNRQNPFTAMLPQMMMMMMRKKWQQEDQVNDLKAEANKIALKRTQDLADQKRLRDQSNADYERDLYDKRVGKGWSPPEEGSADPYTAAPADVRKGTGKALNRPAQRIKVGGDVYVQLPGGQYKKEGDPRAKLERDKELASHKAGLKGQEKSLKGKIGAVKEKILDKVATGGKLTTGEKKAWNMLSDEDQIVGKGVISLLSKDDDWRYESDPTKKKAIRSQYEKMVRGLYGLENGEPEIDLTGKPAGIYSVNGKRIKWDGKGIVK